MKAKIGIPKPHIINPGNAIPRDQNWCVPWEHFISRSYLSLNSPSISRQL